MLTPYPYKEFRVSWLNSVSFMVFFPKAKKAPFLYIDFSKMSVHEKWSFLCDRFILSRLLDLSIRRTMAFHDFEHNTITGLFNSAIEDLSNCFAPTDRTGILYDYKITNLGC